MIIIILPLSQKKKKDQIGYKEPYALHTSHMTAQLLK